MDLSVVPYQKAESDHNEDINGVDDTPLNAKQQQQQLPMFHHQEPVVMNPNPKPKKLYTSIVKYKECMRNHAASIGGHANDGCGEFMPRGDDGLTCAACGCHRNFHRKESSSGSSEAKKHHQFLLSPPPPPPPLPQPQPQQILMYTPPGAGGAPAAGKGMVMTRDFMTSSRPPPHCDVDGGDYYDDDEQDRRSETPERGDVAASAGTAGRSSAKRFRTKFTAEQKERMLEFAEKIGWRIQRHDDMALNQFCSEVGVKRNVLKVWMHNNKNAHRRREEPPLPQPAAAATQPPPAPPQQPLVGV
ncbi:hypothetical protein Tsubulata_030274 [Turnera subulata]|uniref:ZF-HD dimerization-type domain-containing protein n=1 Tax=Turnera subulata TaxID=218843 RepID=A0A9Q0FWN3_9ROSI|nr:hypothetical protein Tsubulata_030274 [Turnera subulata]